MHDDRSSDSASLSWADVDKAFSTTSFVPALNPLHPIALTTDLWSGPDKESYICLTGHFFDDNWNFQRVLLDVFLCTDRHFGENISAWIKQVCSENKIEVRILLDFSLIFSCLTCVFLYCFSFRELISAQLRTTMVEM